MKRFLIWILLLVFPVLSYAQNRTVKGYVFDENRRPIPNAYLRPVGGKEHYDVKSEDGSFSILISYAYTRLAAYCDGYIPVAKEIDGSYMMFILVKDRAAEKAKQEAEEKARKDAEAKAKAEEKARLEAEKERAEAEARAKAEAEEKARAEEEARLEAEREKQEAEEMAKLEAERQAREEEQARIRAEQKKERQAKDDEYSLSFKNQGFEHSIDFSYSYQMNVSCRIPYRYSGYRDYDALHPFEMGYTLYYRPNRLFAVGVGAGALFNAKSISIVGDSFAAPYNNFKETRLDVPVFGALKITPFRKKFRPILGGAAGFYIFSKTLMWEANLGGEIRISGSSALHFCLGIKATPYPVFGSEQFGYDSAISPSVKVGFSF